uniref:Uncharacterized protein n=1 Tax=Arundo donax TaxID=35708 RepID=A0A0A8YG29_ARUDO
MQYHVLQVDAHPPASN